MRICISSSGAPRYLDCDNGIDREGLSISNAATGRSTNSLPAFPQLRAEVRRRIILRNRTMGDPYHCAATPSRHGRLRKPVHGWMALEEYRSIPLIRAEVRCVQRRIIHYILVPQAPISGGDRQS